MVLYNAALLARDRKALLELKAFKVPPPNTEIVFIALHALKNNLNPTNVNWQMVVKGVLSKPLEFTDVDIDRLTPN